MSDDFYEDDEPVEKVREAFTRGDKGVTRRPRDLNQLAKSIVDEATTPSAAIDTSSIDLSRLTIQDTYGPLAVVIDSESVTEGLTVGR